ncbi:MAG: glycosyltransferase family 2 protein [Betaproteobacteria bacterium]|nr:glycosyltransferase family 2 protein [Betaproteobacteria bacterium]MDH3436674.1 glycosyltransferase family 2 protein [Betaproteobacteria bacterium]
MAHFSVVTPVYRADSCLHELYRRLVDALAGITEDFEIVMVEDCGGDRSWEIIRELAQKDSRVKGIQFSRNFGQHYGITAGLDHCDGDWVVVMDCDLQDRPEEIPRLYAKAREGYDVVVAKRRKRNDPLLKRWSSRAFHALFNYLTDTRYDGQAGNFHIISRKVVENFRQMREQLRFFGGLLNWMGFPSTTIEVDHGQRHAGRTSYTFGKLWRLAVDVIIAYSDKPLHLSVRFGFVISLLAFVGGIFIVVLWLLYGTPVVGWPSLFVSIWFIGGVLISLLGIVGIYLGKTFDETKKRPLYVVMRTTDEERAARR